MAMLPPPSLLLLFFSLRFFLDFFRAVCIKTTQDFQNELIRKLNIYDLSKWKINYLHPSDNVECILSAPLAQHYIKLVDQAEFCIRHWFSLVLI